jgi:hypothetical protein
MSTTPTSGPPRPDPGPTDWHNVRPGLALGLVVGTAAALFAKLMPIENRPPPAGNDPVVSGWNGAVAVGVVAFVITAVWWYVMADGDPPEPRDTGDRT